MFKHSVRVPRLYKIAAKIAKEVNEGIGSIKYLVYEHRKKHPNIKALYALVSTLFQRSDELECLLKRSQFFVKEPRADPWLSKILIIELLWGTKRLPGGSIPEITVKGYEQIFKAHMSDISFVPKTIRDTKGQKKNLFKKWFDECFEPEARKWLTDPNLLQRALLFLDNAPGHPSEEELTTHDKCITVMFLSPNCTILIQPMDQYIQPMDQFVKQDYKKKLLLTAILKDQLIETTLNMKELNVNDLVFSLCQSWNALPPPAITSAWKKLWPEIVTTPGTATQISVTSEVIQQVATETQKYRGIDEESVFHQMSDEETASQVSIPIMNQEDDDEDIAATPQVSAKDAINTFELGIQWAEENSI